jgi:hypothetical protein
LLVTITNGTLQDSGKSYIDKVEHYWIPKYKCLKTCFNV